MFAIVIAFATHLRYFNFQAAEMAGEASVPFRQAVRAFCGQTSSDFSSLLSSLPSELAFNDVRDASKRHSKQEKTNPCNLHAACLKSALKRPSGCSTLDLSDADWQTNLKGKTIKGKVHHALRPSDVELGVDVDGLTRHKQNSAYTKPHVWCQRLRLLRVLQISFDNCRGDMDAKRNRVHKVFDGMWTAKLVPAQCFIRWTNRPNDDIWRNIVLASGPHTIQILPLKLIPGSEPKSYTFNCSDGAAASRDPVVVGELDEVEISLTGPTLTCDSILGWSHASAWMSLTQYVSDYSVAEITADTLSKICSYLKIRGHSKLAYKGKVEAFLQHMGKDPETIQHVLDEIPEAAPRPRRDPAEAMQHIVPIIDMIPKPFKHA